MIFAAKALRHLRVQKRDETERPKRLRNEHVRDLAKLSEILTQIVGSQVFRASAYEYLAGHLLYQSFLQKRKKVETNRT